MDKLPFYCTRTSWPEQDVHADGGLIAMIDQAVGITRQTFLKHVDRQTLKLIEQKTLGYDDPPKKDSTMAGDSNVSYHRSKLHGKVVYYFRHYAIEYVFHNFYEDPRVVGFWGCQ